MEVSPTQHRMPYKPHSVTAIGNLQQTTIAKGEHTSSAERLLHFWKRTSVWEGWLGHEKFGGPLKYSFEAPMKENCNKIRKAHHLQETTAPPRFEQVFEENDSTNSSDVCIIYYVYIA